MNNTPILSIEDVGYFYPSLNIPALSHITFSVDPGQFVSLVGPNGSGKTTLMKIASGWIKPTTGCVTLKGKNIACLSLSRRAQIISLVTQSGSIGFPYTALESVLMGSYAGSSPLSPISDAQLEDARKIMELTQTWQFASKIVTELSGGELQRVFLARALIQKPQLLLLDEATSDLDLSSKLYINTLLRQYVDEEGLSVLSINHDLSSAYRFSHRVVALHEGTIVAHGTPEEVFTQSFFRNVFNIEVVTIPQKGFVVTNSFDS